MFARTFVFSIVSLYSSCTVMKWWRSDNKCGKKDLFDISKASVLLVSSPPEWATETMLRAEKTNKKKTYLVLGEKNDVTVTNDNNNNYHSNENDDIINEGDEGWYTKTGRKRKHKKIIEEKRPYKRHRLLEINTKIEDHIDNNNTCNNRSYSGTPKNNLISNDNDSNNNSNSNSNSGTPTLSPFRNYSNEKVNSSSAMKEGYIKPVRGRPRLSDVKPKIKKNGRMGRPRSMPMDGVNDSSLPPNKVLAASGTSLIKYEMR